METIEEKVCLGHYMSFHYMSYTLNLFSVYIQLQLFPDQRNAGMVSFLFGYSSLRFSFPPFPLTAGDDPSPLWKSAWVPADVPYTLHILCSP